MATTTQAAALHGDTTPRTMFRVSMCGSAQEVEQLSRDGSHYSLSTGILPSLGARSNRRMKLRKFTISPYDRRFRFVSPFSEINHLCWFPCFDNMRVAARATATGHGSCMFIDCWVTLFFLFCF